jgi:5'-nucleotidase
MWTPVSVRHYDGKVVPGADPTGHELFWFAVVPIETTEQ